MEAGSRWWEFYFVRYAIGTLVGMAIINFAGRINSDLKNILLFGIDQKENFFAGTSLQVAYGLLFCYVSSIPILVIHAARFSLPKGIVGRFTPAFLKSENWSTKNMWVAFFLAIAIVLALVQIILSTLHFLINNIRNEEFLTLSLIILVTITFIIEYVCVFSFFIQREKIYEGIKALSRARASDMNKGGLIDSYKHLREHGNSILIVIFEIILGAVLLGLLYVITNDIDVSEKMITYAAWSISILLFWMLPGAAVWLLATWVERRFAFDEEIDV